MEGAVDAPVGCPAGTYNDKEYGKNMSDCMACRPGHFCQDTGLSSPSGECYAGYYCKKGSKFPNPAITSDDSGPCPIGHYCPNGTANPHPCEPGTYNSLEQQEKCLPCKDGHYCLEGAINSTECEAGYYCPNGYVQ